jgi:aconitate hydratase
MPDNVSKVSELKNVKVNQVFIGSCTNASYTDIVKAARILKGKKVHPDVSLAVGAGTRQTLQELIRDGVIQDLITSGARIMECGCGACVGIGQAPNTNGVSVRTSNRNFKGRSGSLDAFVYLASPEVSAATAITGYIIDPREVIDADTLKNIEEPEEYYIDDTMFIAPPENSSEIEIYRGPNIKPLPLSTPLAEKVEADVVTKLEDNITTDDIIPAGSIFSSLRSNVPEISKITFGRIDPTFVERAKKLQKSIIVGGENYGQGSSREHAAIAPMYLGVKAVIAKSIARIHKANLINFGILPLIFKNKEDYALIEMGDTLVIEDAINQVMNKTVTVFNKTKNVKIETVIEVSDREANLLAAGGRFNYVKSKNEQMSECAAGVEY